MERMRPFEKTAGRDTSTDQPPPFDIASYYYDQREAIGRDVAILRQLAQAVDRQSDLEPPQWAQWYSVARGFAPDLILELGRDRGNSTAVFAQVLASLGGGRVVSLCQSNNWASVVAPRIARLVDHSWFERVDARLADIISADYEAILRDHQRVLVLWDAHGFEIAEVVLGEILPRLVGREHLVLLHDISDNRYAGVPRSYGGHPLWKGSVWQTRTKTWNSRVNIGWMNSSQDQVVALADFSARNTLEIGSADHEYATFFAAHPDRADDMRQTIGPEMFSTLAHWAFLSLSGKSGPFHFPPVASRRPRPHSADVVVEGAGRLPAELTTPARAWAYAVTWTWRPAVEIAPNEPVCLRLRVYVEGGAIGVSLLSADEKYFVQSKIAGVGTGDVLVPIADVNHPGRLVIHTWDTPTPARVRIDGLSLVW